MIAYECEELQANAKVKRTIAITFAHVYHGLFFATTAQASFKLKLLQNIDSKNPGSYSRFLITEVWMRNLTHLWEKYLYFKARMQEYFSRTIVCNEVPGTWFKTMRSPTFEVVVATTTKFRDLRWAVTGFGVCALGHYSSPPTRTRV